MAPVGSVLHGFMHGYGYRYGQKYPQVTHAEHYLWPVVKSQSKSDGDLFTLSSQGNNSGFSTPPSRHLSPNLKGPDLRIFKSSMCKNK
jgi:hypothetical protein